MSSSRQSLLRVPTSPLTAGTAQLSEEASHYVSRVHRRGIGETVLLFDPAAGTEAVAELVAVGGKRVSCRLGEVRLGTQNGIPGLHLIQGLGKGDKPDQVVRDGTVLGANSIRFVVCERSVAQTTDRHAAKLDRLVRIATEAARQCGRSNLPAIELGLAFDRAVASSTTPPLESEGGSRSTLVLHPGGQFPLVEEVVAKAAGSGGKLQVSIWVGPEGGFSDAELAALAAAGASLASLGDLVLRTELAAIVALARVGASLATLK